MYLTAADLEREKVLESSGVQMIRLNKFNLGKDPVASIDGLLRERLDGINNGQQAIDVDGRFRSARVIDVLSRLVSDRGAPAVLRSDNGPEFVSKALLSWTVAR